MSEITLHPTSANCVTCVPDYFIDKYMIEANGEYVKIYLYILRCLGRSTKGFSITKIAEDLDHTQKDIRKALHYWERAGLLELTYDDYDELSCIYLKVPEEIEFKTIAVRPALAEIPKPSLQYVPEVLEPIVNEDERLKDLAYLAEKLFGHPLSADNLQQIVFWQEDLHLSWDLIEYIIEYSVDKGNTSFKYMEKIALNYAKEGIFTVDQAKAINNAFLSTSFAIKSAFGISGRNLGQAELDYVNKWTKEYGFSSEIIGEACKRTLINAKEPSFQYADTILASWNSLNVKNLSDLIPLDEEHKNRATSVALHKTTSQKDHNFTERSDLDYKDIEQKLLRS